MATNEESGNLYTEAVEWLSLGVSTVPCQRGAKTPAVQWGRYQRQLPTLRDLEIWYARPRNIAVLCGWQGLTVLDFDDLPTYDRAVAESHELADLAERTYRVITSRGVHVHVRCDEPVRTQHFGGLDVIGAGGYVIGAGSVHPSGALYTAVGHKTDIARVATLPDILSNPVSTRSDCGLLSIDRATATRTRDLDVLDNPPAELGYDPLGRVLARYKAMDFLTTRILPSGPGWGLTNCPLHDDEHPSLLVNMRRGDVRCLAGCNSGKWMDAVRLFAELHKISDKTAVRMLAERL